MEPSQESDGLTIEQAAQLLFVSQTYIRQLVAEGRLSCLRATPAGDLQIPRAAALAYRSQMKKEQREGLDKMVRATDRMGMYDAEAEQLPTRPDKE
jgi:excisionase family DNA binding protein